MVFSSVPIYLDPPSWNQQQAHQQPTSGSSGGGEAHQITPPVAAAPRPEGAMAGSVRPVSMAERARLAKVPQPEPALKCPRCDSSNTKFCYFNNYSLLQPRHFCKTCRRYWTRGGALRNVPVGGGCRRNKRSKATGSSSKSAAAASGASSSSSSSSTTAASSGAIPSNITLPPQLPFMPSLHPLADYGSSNMSLNFTGIQPIDAVDYQLGSSMSVGLENWRLQQIQQFPFLGALDQPPPAPAPVPGIYPFDGEGGVDATTYPSQVQLKASSSGLITQLASVKMEDNPQTLNMPRQYFGIPGNDHYWGVGGSGGGGSSSGAWATDLSGFHSSSSGNIL